MPRTARIDAPNLFQHVIARGIECRGIFEDEDDCLYLLSQLGLLLQEAASPCYAWVFMRNHIHLLVRTGNIPLASVMQRLLGSYANYFNARHDRTGHLFQNRYKSIVVEDEKYLTALIAYIHLNPIRANAVESISDLEGYQWSGHPAVCGEISYTWQNTELVLDVFGSQSAYLKYLAARIAETPEDLDGGGFHRSKNLAKTLKITNHGNFSFDSRVLGSSDYADRLLDKLDLANTPRRSDSAPDCTEKLLRSICRYFDVTQTELRTTSRTAELSKARAMFSALAIEQGFICAEIARQLCISEPATKKAVVRGKICLRNDPGLREALTSLVG